MIVTDDLPLDLRDPVWGDPGWPAKFTALRSHQVDAIVEIAADFASGADVVIVDAPPGSGKTVLAEAVRRILTPRRTIYCPNTIQLQNQVAAEFPYAKVLAGRSNYPTRDYPGAFGRKWDSLSTADCMRRKEVLPACGNCSPAATPIAVPHCSLCHPVTACPYARAKDAALGSPLAILNMAYFIAEANSGKSQFSGIELAILDEADTLGDVLMGQAEVFISKRRIAELGLGYPEKKTVVDSWRDWLTTEALLKIGKLVTEVRAEVNQGSREVDVIRRLGYLERLQAKLKLLDRSLESGNAVYDGYDEGNIRFQPVRVAPFGPSMVWAHAEKFLVMSATIVSFRQRAEEWGLDLTDLRWDAVTVPSTYPPERRPVHVKPVANMVHKEKETEWPKMAAALRAVLGRHEGDRVLVHTVSYELTRYLHDALRDLGRPVFIYASAKDRTEILSQFRKQDAGVLLAPSMDRGIDLPFDDCRAVVICKIPFPNMGDKRVNARLYSQGGRDWLATEVVASLIQMSGRGMRSEDDHCSVWILDQQFVSNIWRNYKSLFPQWWVEAIDWSGGGLSIQQGLTS